MGVVPKRRGFCVIQTSALRWSRGLLVNPGGGSLYSTTWQRYSSTKEPGDGRSRPKAPPGGGPAGAGGAGGVQPAGGPGRPASRIPGGLSFRSGFFGRAVGAARRGAVHPYRAGRGAAANHFGLFAARDRRCRHGIRRPVERGSHRGPVGPGRSRRNGGNVPEAAGGGPGSREPQAGAHRPNRRSGKPGAGSRAAAGPGLPGRGGRLDFSRGAANRRRVRPVRPASPCAAGGQHDRVRPQPAACRPAALEQMQSRAELYELLDYRDYEQRDRQYFEHSNG